MTKQSSKTIRKGISFTAEQQKLLDKLVKETGLGTEAAVVRFALAELAKARGI
jgi:hypothetical protein